MLRLAPFMLMAVLAGCQIGSVKPAPKDAALGGLALQAPEVSVQSLEAPNPGESAAAVAPTAGRPKPKPNSPPAPEQPQQPPPAPAPVVKSASHLACDKIGGLYVIAGKSGAYTCQKRTKDAGKSCRRETDCEGACLARSRSCAPVMPLFGCNEILQADGRQVALCID